jgi:pilus assembly protein CpaF
MMPTVLADPDVTDLAARVHQQVVTSRLGLDAADRSVGRAAVDALVRLEVPLMSDATVAEITDRVLARAVGLGPLEPFLGDPDITDVMVNGGGQVWIEQSGQLRATGLVLPESMVLHLIERVLAPLGLHIDRASPIVDARLADGSRVHAIVRPLAVDGPCLTIRRFAARAIRLDDLAGSGLVAFLAWAVAARMNIIVSGGAGAGKTTLLNALGAFIPDHERVVTIEDAAELRLPGAHVVRLEARPASAEGVGEVRIRELVRTALRMRPDRIIVGEVRSGEALDMLQAMNTGHAGSLSTCHANGPTEALHRIETMVLMSEVALPHAVVREQVASALDLVVQVGRGAGGHRAIVEVAEVGRVDQSGAISTTLLTTDGELRSLPSRPHRGSTATAPDPGWIEP